MRLSLLVVLLAQACTTNHSVYVSNGNGAKAGVKKHIDATAKVKIDSELNGIKHQTNIGDSNGQRNTGFISNGSNK